MRGRGGVCGQRVGHLACRLAGGRAGTGAADGGGRAREGTDSKGRATAVVCMKMMRNDPSQHLPFILR